MQFVCVVAVVAADSAYKAAPIPILKDDRSQNAYGETSFSFETGNGISRSEEGRQNDGNEQSGSWRQVSKHFNSCFWLIFDELKIPFSHYEL